ncbi:hypothetical protein V500_07083 [Pseudogymnoascus sp. VKM F-4518 (FW-2643)]|nr:hypothetical protein V500_07083 [Pseudogymnoascus sp. VKM F-4518 (FW-2643)]
MTEHLYFSLTQHLLSDAVAEFEKATQSPFLRAAAEGRLDKKTLRSWLVNDRQYIHAYIIGAEGFLAEIQHPKGGSPGAADTELDESELALVAWLTEGVANVRREEQFFVEVAARYGIGLEPRTDDGESESVYAFEALFEHIPPIRDVSDPWWLQGAILFWATEKCYLEAWSWAKTQLNDQGPEKDADGGALRTEFIPNWTSPEFAAFVDRLAHIIDDAVNKLSEDIEDMKETDPKTVTDLREAVFLQKSVQHPRRLFRQVLGAEEKFWPVLE